jgi:hypothetical protein
LLAKKRKRPSGEREANFSEKRVLTPSPRFRGSDQEPSASRKETYRSRSPLDPALASEVKIKKVWPGEM